ncbi:hypothetical protein QUF54_01960 [Candidatus Marithioploca araucensis]|uniref:Uncharacterized protein n=1 Tax=Candidatus Marithioploca araucensis TaxID=70273 RepID=A0ABT7VSK7_9GAMM|nr:hypothetical protein [Candidatus Marithioploca araucensis]
MGTDSGRASVLWVTRRWRVANAFPRQRVGTRKLLSLEINFKPCRVGNVFLLPTTFLMRKVGKKRTLHTLHDYMTT